jgi:hypothetical protein
VVAVIVNPNQFQQFGSWLVFHEPILPLIWDNIALYAGFGDSINTLDPSPIRSSQNLRVVMLVEKAALTPAMFLQLKSRFPQAVAWIQAPSRHPDDAAIWYADLNTTP